MNSLRKKLQTKGFVVGTFCGLGSSDVVEIASRAGFDFVVVDWQHGTFSQQSACEALRAMQGTDTLAVIRPPVGGLFAIEWLLDMGYLTVLVPMVSTLEQAQALVQAAYYPPQGRRSQSTCRANLVYGPDYWQEFNRELSLLVMIEEAQAVEMVGEIARTPGVAGCFVGVTDLGSSLQAAGQTGAEQLERAVEQVRVACLEVGKIAGIAAPSVEEARRRVAQGFQFITLATDRRLLTQTFQQASGAIRAG
jgi:4-hydroxy-2-oxoheptanedioate aldolase